MSQQFVPPTRAPLIDGREFRIEGDGAHIGERFHPLAQIQEARLLFLRPETIGLTLANVGQVEYSFARPGDGVAALETLYALRPDLRRADAPPPAAEAPAGYFAPVAPVAPEPPPFIPPYGAQGQPGMPYGAPRPGYQPRSQAGYPAAPFPPQLARAIAPTPFPPHTLEAYGPEPNHTHAELTPAPRSAGQLIGATFRLFGKRFGALLTLALLVSTLPAATVALLNALVSALSGVNPLAGAANPLTMLQQAANGQSVTTAPTTTPTTASSLDAFIGLLSLVAVILTLLVAAWSQATLTIGARQAALGRPISVRACAREGLTRIWPTLWALVFLYGALAIIAIPGLGLALALVLGPNQPGAAQVTAQDTFVLAIFAGVIAAGTLLLLAYLWVRFALYPTAAALGLPQPLRMSLALTSFGWWRVFGALFVVTLVAGLLTVPANAAQLYSVALAAVILAPLTQLITGPLDALIRVGALYDQRLRREGYALFEQEGLATPPSAPSAPTTERPSEVSQ